MRHGCGIRASAVCTAVVALCCAGCTSPQTPRSSPGETPKPAAEITPAAPVDQPVTMSGGSLMAFAVNSEGFGLISGTMDSYYKWAEGAVIKSVTYSLGSGELVLTPVTANVFKITFKTGGNTLVVEATDKAVPERLRFAPDRGLGNGETNVRRLRRYNFPFAAATTVTFEGMTVSSGKPSDVGCDASLVCSGFTGNVRPVLEISVVK